VIHIWGNNKSMLKVIPKENYTKIIKIEVKEKRYQLVGKKNNNNQFINERER
jgi:hypothetical protein